MGTTDTPDTPPVETDATVVVNVDADETPDDTTDTLTDGDQAIAVAAGAASADADHATDVAESAEFTAEIAKADAASATQIATSAAAQALDTGQRLDTMDRKIDVLGEGIAQLLDRMEQTQDVVEDVLPGEQFPDTPGDAIPDDTAPESGHWWNRRIGRRN